MEQFFGRRLDLVMTTFGAVSDFPSALVKNSDIRICVHDASGDKNQTCRVPRTVGETIEDRAFALEMGCNS
jgi:hypothetical protein